MDTDIARVGCRGDTPFCSEECRLVQIEMDEGAEQRRRHSLKASSSTDSNKAGAAASPSKSHEAHARTGTVVAAGRGPTIYTTRHTEL
ncbi:hypothetical protein C4D60_Mb09t10960 [Musa balbisiana]|uniref:FLZ-type domain-containing protein n=1 Tax=Musa balbisiana TaxID=52838 RepID=A0A4S8IFI1_MUSBA|nr:hypothetical protein C4D60_Mb09t10960 [Musa balbisiana]